MEKTYTQLLKEYIDDQVANHGLRDFHVYFGPNAADDPEATAKEVYLAITGPYTVIENIDDFVNSIDVSNPDLIGCPDELKDILK